MNRLKLGKGRSFGNRNLARLVAFAAGVMMPGGWGLHAEAITWAEPEDGNFGRFTNWNPERVPTSGDTAVFRHGSGGYTVLVDEDVTTGLKVDGDAITLEIGADNTLTNENDSWLGVDSYGSLTLIGGTLRSAGNADRLARNNHSSASLTITGPTAIWETSKHGMEIARDGPAEVVVENGAKVVARQDDGRIDIGKDGNTGKLILRGRGSEWDGRGVGTGTEARFRVGNKGGRGVIRIEDGARLDHNADLWFGGAGGFSVTVKGDASVLESGSRIFAREGPGSNDGFSVEDGGLLRAEQLELSENGGPFTISGAASRVDVGDGGSRFQNDALAIVLKDVPVDELVSVSGDLEISGTELELSLQDRFSGQRGDVIPLIAADGRRKGEFANWADGTAKRIDGFAFEIDYGAREDGRIELRIRTTP